MSLEESGSRGASRASRTAVISLALVLVGCGARSDLDSNLGDDTWGEPPAATADDGSASPQDATIQDAASDGGLGDGSLFDSAGADVDLDARDGSPAWDAGVDPPATVASALQIDPAHDGTIDDPLLVGPLRRLWSVTLPALVSYPIIARDLIVVVTARFDSQAQLVAFHGHTGARAWGPIDLGSGPTGLGVYGAATYENGRIYTSEEDGVVRAFDVATGTPLWTTSWPASSSSLEGCPPTAYRGVVYVEGTSGTSGGLLAIDEASGKLLWQSAGEGDPESDPAVTDDGVFVSHNCKVTSRHDRLSGAVIWELPRLCESGGGGWAPVVAGGLVYARQGAEPYSYIAQVSDGTVVGTLSSFSPPAIHDGSVFLLSNGILEALDPLGQTEAWSFGDGTLITPPIVVSGRVFVGSSDGTLYGLDEKTGAQVWSDDAGVPFEGLDELSLGGFEPAALAAAGGLLVAPAGNSLIVYGAAPDVEPSDSGASDATGGSAVDASADGD